MNSPTLYGQNTVVQLQKLYDWQNETRWHYATLPGSTESYGEGTQTCTVTFENHPNLLAYLANWPQFTSENGFQGTIKHQGGPFLGFVQDFSALIVQSNCQNRLLLKHSYVYYRLSINYVSEHIDDSPTLN